MDIKIVVATVDMCRDLAQVKRSVWETTYRGIYPDSKIDGFDIDKEAEKFERLVGRADINLYGIVAEDNLIGYMAWGKNPRYPDGDSNEIVLLSILKDYQGKGIGGQVFEYAKGKLKDKGDHFTLYCNKYNLPAQAFYEKMGCEVISVDDDHLDKSIPQIKYIYRF